MKAEVLPDYNSSYTNTSNIENGHIHQPELDLQLKNIISLIQVGLIDPKENPIIIGTPKDDDGEKSTRLSFCDKLKIVGILVFLIIVTVVVTLCIIYMFVPFFSKKSKNTDYKALGPKSISQSIKSVKDISDYSACKNLWDNEVEFNSFFGIIEVSSTVKNVSFFCLGALIQTNKLITSLNCFSVLKNLSNFSMDQKNKYLSNEYLMETHVIVYLNLKGINSDIKTMDLYKIKQIKLIDWLNRQEMIELEFQNNKEPFSYLCVKNSKYEKNDTAFVMMISIEKSADSIKIIKQVQRHLYSNCSDQNLKKNIIGIPVFIAEQESKYYSLIDFKDNNNCL